MSTDATGDSYVTSPTRRVEGANGITYAYRDQGSGDEAPVILLQHFRGNLDNWDPSSTRLRPRAKLPDSSPHSGSSGPAPRAATPKRSGRLA